MRSRILGIKTSDGWFKLSKRFPPIKNSDGSTTEEDFTATHIEHIELTDGDGDVFGFYSVWGFPPENSELAKNATAIVLEIGYDEVKRVYKAVPAEDMKTRFEAYEKTLSDDFKELPGDLPREQLLVHKARIERLLAALDEDSDGSDESEESGPASTEVTENAKSQAQAVGGDNP